MNKTAARIIVAICITIEIIAVVACGIFLGITYLVYQQDPFSWIQDAMYAFICLVAIVGIAVFKARISFRMKQNIGHKMRVYE